MGTSKSRKTAQRWVATAHIFSGRPDPAWTVPNRVAERLIGAWEALPACNSSPSPPGLGYRGSVLRDTEGREWFSYGGVVILRAQGTVECREDRGRRFEKLLLASAPHGTLPNELREIR